VSCASEVPVAEEDAVTVSDGCGGTVTVTVDDAISNQSCANRYTLTRTWTARDACGNSATASQTITVDDTIKPTFISDLPENISVCDELPISPVLEAIDNCGIDTIYFTEILDTLSGIWQYYRTWEARDICGNSTSHTQIITLHKTIRNRLQRTICSGDSVLINDLYYSISGNYLDTLSTIFGCDSILDISIDVLSLPEIDLDIKGNRVLCENHNTIILATKSQNGTYQWYKDNLIIEGANDSLLSINKAGIYSVSITSLDGCKKSDTISILASEQCPRNDTFSICIPLRYDSTVCFNEWIQLPTTINNISFCENPKEEVDIAFNSQNGCADIFINAVENFSDSFCVVFCDDISICDTLIVFLCGEKRTLPPIAVDDCIALEKNTEKEIDVLLNDYDPDGHFLINSGIIIPPKYGEAYVSQEGKVIYNPIKYYCGKDTLYYKVCDNIDGCDTGLVCISIDCECIYPEVITPNNDGINDNLVIPCIIGVDNAKLVIWNRWGSIIYENDNYKNDWTGTYKGDELPVGTYWYSIEYYHPDSKEKIQEVRYFMIIK
jgi:gliding motility-associated-like protein